MYSHLLITFSSARGTLYMADNLDHSGEDELRRRLDDAMAAGCQHLNVDCRYVRYIERPSLTALSAAKAQLGIRGGSLLVTRRSAAFVRAAWRDGFPELLRAHGTAAPDNAFRTTSGLT